MIPYSRQDISEQDIAAVVEVLRSDWLTQGPAVTRFEQAIAKYCDAQYGVAVSHGTAALHLACLALDLGPGDVCWTSPNSFVASANCARYCGADVDFVDIDPATYNMSIAALTAKLESAAQAGRLPKIVIPVHFAGQSCEMQAIAELAKQYNFRIIEDASHALSGDYQSLKIGGCHYSDITVFSFHPVKPMTTGEGGMLTCNDPALEKRLRLYASHGITRDEQAMQQQPHGGWYYEQIDLGYNYRLTDLQAALGLSQLNRLDDFAAAREACARRYDAALKDLPLQLPWQHNDARSAWHLYVVQLKNNARISRKSLFKNLRGAGIGVNVHYLPINNQPYYRALGFSPDDCPAAQAYYENAISLPLHPGLTENEQQIVINQLTQQL